MKRGVLFAGTVVCIFSFEACTILPELNEASGGIPAFDIVLRTKCELADALADNAGYSLVIHPEFRWLKTWVAQVDFTLQVLDQATFSPGGSFTQPLRNAYPVSSGPSTVSTAGVLGTSVSAVAQNFTVAAGVSVNGEAQRTETMSFAFSVDELGRFRARPDYGRLCAVSDRTDLRGGLGLKKWLRDTMVPVIGYQELLFAGYHPKPGASSA